jgi:hypothetical protein
MDVLHELSIYNQDFVCINRLRLNYIQSICGAFAASHQSVVLSCYLHTLVSLRHLTSIHSKQSASCCVQYQLIMVLQMFDFKGHGLANRLIVGSNDGGTTSFDLQHQKKYVVIVISSSCKLRYYHSTRKETKRDDFHATDHWIPRIGY